MIQLSALEARAVEVDATYGNAKTPTIREDHPQEPTNPYGLTKLVCEKVISSIAPVCGIRRAMLRYFNVIGNDPEGEIFERHEPETHVLPNLIKAAFTGGSFSLFGTNHATPDGTAVRDYVHVMDLAQAHIRAIDMLSSTERFVSNVGTGAGVSVRQLVGIVEKELSIKVNVEEKPIRPGDPPELVADDGFLQTWFRHEFKTVNQAVREIAAVPRVIAAISRTAWFTVLNSCRQYTVPSATSSAVPEHGFPRH